MYITPIGKQAFCAEISRQQYQRFNPHTRMKETFVSTQEDMIDSYDKALKAVAIQKQIALDLDKFMQSLDVKRELYKLPKQGIIEINSNFDPGTLLKDFGREYPDIVLTYHQDTDRDMIGENAMQEIEDSVFYPIQSDGSIDKEGIVNWMAELNSRFNK